MALAALFQVGIQGERRLAANWRGLGLRRRRHGGMHLDATDGDPDRRPRANLGRVCRLGADLRGQRDRLACQVLHGSCWPAILARRELPLFRVGSRLAGWRWPERWVDGQQRGLVDPRPGLDPKRRSSRWGQKLAALRRWRGSDRRRQPGWLLALGDRPNLRVRLRRPASLGLDATGWLNEERRRVCLDRGGLREAG